MITIKEGSHSFFLLRILSVAGEIPQYSLDIMGSEQTYKRLVHKMCEVQEYRNARTGERLTVKALIKSGAGKYKTVRLHKKAKRLLEWIGTAEYYENNFCRNGFPSDIEHKRRNHKIAEVLMILCRAGITFSPQDLPCLNYDYKTQTLLDNAYFYPSRDLKQYERGELKKLSYTSIVGALLTKDEGFCVYNLRDEMMNWSFGGEVKAEVDIRRIARMNTARNPEKDKTPCIMFARNAKAVLDTIANCKTRQSKKDANGKWKSIRIQTIERVYSSLHYLPLDGFGARLLKVITQPNHVKRILRAVYKESEVEKGAKMFEYDGIIEDTVYSLCHLDGDIRRLIAFCNGLELYKEKGEVLCFEFQREYVEEYVKGKNIEVFTVSLEEVERVLDLSV